MELVVVLLLTLIAFPVVEFTDGVPRIILGIAFLLLFPGYSLMAALFPRRDSMGGVERAALTLVLSFVLVSLTGLILNYTPWGIRLTPIFVANALLITIASLTGLWRRRGLPPADRFALRVTISMPRWGSASRLDRALSVGLAIAVICATSTLAYVIARPKPEQAFTDFYILGPEGMMENYPQELVLGGRAEVTLGIKNHENQDTSYRVVVTLDEEKLEEIGPIDLADEEEWATKIILVPYEAGEDQKVEFLLHKGEELVPYLTLRLWLDVSE